MSPFQAAGDKFKEFSSLLDSQFSILNPQLPSLPLRHIKVHIPRWTSDPSHILLSHTV